MDLRLLRRVATCDAIGVVALALASPAHGAAAVAGYAPALVATLVVHRAPSRRRAARALCAVGIMPNTALAIRVARRGPKLSAMLAIGGAVLGLGYLRALRR